MTVSVFTLGCKVNQYESGQIIRRLREQGYEVIHGLGFADCYIVNTCAVTQEAEKKSRQMIARIKKINPAAKIFLCGCAVQNNPEQFGKRDGVFFLKGTADKEDIINHLNEKGCGLDALPKEYSETGNSCADKIRATIKIQDGCNHFCSYCIVPYLRGRSRSRKIEHILSEASENDSKEIVLTGVDISAFGKDTGESLSDLVLQLDRLGKRFRFGSLETGRIEEGFVDALKQCRNLCDHFHLSLQSGSDGVLKKMNRPYTTEEYRRAVELLRKNFPHCGITTDIIAGFPTETEEEHRQCLQFVKEIGFSDIHVFPYSVRPGTKAAKMPQVAEEVKRRRTEELLEVKQVLKHEFAKKCEGIECSVLCEKQNGNYAEGYAENYLKVYVKNGTADEIYRVKIGKVWKDGVIAEGGEKC